MITNYLSTNHFILPINFQESLNDASRPVHRSSIFTFRTKNIGQIKESEYILAKNIGSIALTSITKGIFDIFFDYILDSSENRIKKNMKHVFLLGTAHASEYLSSFLSYQLIQKALFRNIPNHVNTSFISSSFIDNNFNFIQKCSIFVGSGVIYTTLNTPFYIFEISPNINFSPQKITDKYTPIEIVKTIGKTLVVNFFFTLGYGVTISLLAPKARAILTNHCNKGNRINHIQAFFISRSIERVATIIGSLASAPFRIKFSNGIKKANAHSVLGQVRYLTPSDF
ncbi:hypothetical protein M9Y10_044559 [Tritrichomonas musculus]|uniref:Uncharacterized protein n=1 Tax=Tritrichomonas musculus TaxID=1915356 RepID=A0ABR2JSQ1_9EUKA